MPILLSDIRYGGRMLIRRPGLNALAILARALGIGPTSLAVAVVNERFVQRFFPEGGAAGTTNPRHEGVYIPLVQNVINFMSLIVRTEQAPMSYTAAIQREVNTIDPTLPLYWVRSLEEQYGLDAAILRAFGALFAAFGFSALALATIGLYGVMSFSVGQRTREIGVRMALGARARDVQMMVLRQGAVQIGAGLLLGLGLAALLSRGLRILLFGVEPWDSGIFMAVVLTLGAAALVACVVPARRATRVDPVDALRCE